PTPGTRCTPSPVTPDPASPTAKAPKHSGPAGMCSPPPVRRSPVASTTVLGARHRRFPAAVIQRILGVAAAACLAIDAYVHFHDPGLYDAVTTRVLSQAALFRVQASLAAAAGVALLIRPSRLWWAAALMIAGSAFGAVMLYRYVNIGPLGPV